METQPFAAFATQAGGAPYASLVAFAATADLARIVFPARAGSRKVRNLAGSRRVALLIDNRSNEPDDYRDAVAATALGTALVESAARGPLRARLRKKHPSLAAFLDEPDCRIVVVRVAEYRMVTQFESVRILRRPRAAAKRLAARG